MSGVVIFTVVILFLTVFFSAVYYIYALKLDFPMRRIIKSLSSLNICTELISLVRLSLKKVNGWNKKTVIYTIFQYVLNIWSISFSFISIYCTVADIDKIYSVLFSFASVLALVSNLFLRSDKKWATFREVLAKWATFREVLAKGRIETNNFLSKCNATNNFADLVNEYANTIINFEKDLKDSEIS